jgi:AraC family ethanolamine operon transcriptional activator
MGPGCHAEALELDEVGSWSIDSTDPDETNALQSTFGGLHIRHDQIANGRYSARLKAVRVADLQFAVTSYGSGIAANGAPPPGAYAFALPLGPTDGVFLNYEAFGTSAIGMISPDREFNLLRPAEFPCLTVFAGADRLDRLADAMFGRTFSGIGRNHSVLTADEGALRACSRHLAQLCNTAVNTPAHLKAWSAALGGTEQLASEIIDDVLGTIGPLQPTLGWSNNKYIVSRAWELVEDDSRSIVTVAELCTQLGVPIRSLDEAFRSHSGVKPKQFIVAMRLNKVRRMLNRPSDMTTVTEAATRYGFFHFGHFSRAYRHLFGEVPSETLRRARR